MRTGTVTAGVPERTPGRIDGASLPVMREAWQAEARVIRADARANREAWQAEARALRAEAAADREALGRLTGIVEEVRADRR